MKDRFGTIILLGTLFFLATSKPMAPEPPLMMEFDRNRIRAFGMMLNIASEEMISVADCENIEEHLIGKSEQIFDDFAKETDFIGPDFITKPLARRAVRPVVKTVVRYVDKKCTELSEKKEKNHHE